MNIKLRDFESQILYFNGMYKLPISAFPSTSVVAAGETKKNPTISADTIAIIQRLKSFKKTLLDEVSEVDDIITKLHNVIPSTFSDRASEPYAEIDFLVDMADWLGDIQVYCASEMTKFGIPLKETLSIIMSSNFSKLAANGEAIYDEHGKVQKGPAYWKPEPQIKAMLEEKIADAHVKSVPSGIVWREEESKAAEAKNV